VSVIRSLFLFIAVSACELTPAWATMRIVNDQGGQLNNYVQAFAKIRSSGERLVIDGDCLSACTVVLGLLPSNQICVTHRARFGFHLPLTLNSAGHYVVSTKATQALWNMYPASVQHWIEQRGGLSRQLIYMQGDELKAIVSACDRATLTALLVAGASGYSGTLRPLTHQLGVRAFSARIP
jgi:hypothetical protein